MKKLFLLLSLLMCQTTLSMLFVRKNPWPSRINKSLIKKDITKTRLSKHQNYDPCILQKDKELTKIFTLNFKVREFSLLKPFAENNIYSLINQQKELIDTYNSDAAKSKSLIVHNKINFLEIEIYPKD